MLHAIDHTAVIIFYVIFLCKVVKSMYENKKNIEDLMVKWCINPHPNKI